LLSHGQASVERGFSVNKEVSVEHLAETSLIAQITIVEHISSVGGFLKVDYCKELLLSAYSARSKYYQYLDEKKKEAENNTRNNRKRKVIDAILDIEKKKKRMENDTKVLNKSAEEYVGKTENKRKFRLIAKSKSMRRNANDTPKTLETFEKEL
jgi:hypothetical protein